MHFVNQGVSLVWESYKLDPYVQRLADTDFNFQEKVSLEKSAHFFFYHVYIIYRL